MDSVVRRPTRRGLPGLRRRRAPLGGRPDRARRARSAPVPTSRQSPRAITAPSPTTARDPWGCTRLTLTKPVIAAVEGYAVAGGIELALWCDLRVAAEDAVFGVFCRRFGVPLCDLGTVRLPRIVGHGRAMDLILTGRAVGAPEALTMGLANRVVPPGQALAASLALAHQLAALPQVCLRSDRMSALEQWGLTRGRRRRERGPAGTRGRTQRRDAGGRGTLRRRGRTRWRCARLTARWTGRGAWPPDRRRLRLRRHADRLGERVPVPGEPARDLARAARRAAPVPRPAPGRGHRWDRRRRGQGEIVHPPARGAPRRRGRPALGRLRAPPPAAPPPRGHAPAARVAPAPGPPHGHRLGVGGVLRDPRRRATRCRWRRGDPAGRRGRWPPDRRVRGKELPWRREVRPAGRLPAGAGPACPTRGASSRCSGSTGTAAAICACSTRRTTASTSAASARSAGCAGFRGWPRSWPPQPGVAAMPDGVA